MTDYHIIASTFTGWTLTEIKALPAPERRFWREVAEFQHSQRK